MTRAAHSANSNRPNIVGAFTFGLILVALIGYVVVKVDCLEPGKFRIIGIVCALLAGLMGGFMTGSIGVRWQPDSALGKMAIRAGGGLACFVLVLWWWLASSTVPTCRQIYNVRVNVVNSQKQPVSDFEIWNSIDTTPAKASIFWVF